MAKSVLLLVCVLMVALVCAAHAGRIPGEPRRQLSGAQGPTDVHLTLLLDVTHLPEAFLVGARAAVGEKGSRGAPIALVAGKVNELPCGGVQLRKPGVVHVKLHILGSDYVVAVDLAIAKAVMGGDGRATAVVVFVLDQVKGVLHLRNQDGHCSGSDIIFVGFQTMLTFIDNVRG